MITCATCGATNHDDTVKCAACGTFYNPPAPSAPPSVYGSYMPPVPPAYTTITPPVYTPPPTAYGQGYGYAVASLILGIIACISLGWGWIHSILAIVFGGIAKSKGYYDQMATTGIVLGIISLVLFFISFFSLCLPWFIYGF